MPPARRAPPTVSPGPAACAAACAALCAAAGCGAEPLAASVEPVPAAAVVAADPAPNPEPEPAAPVPPAALPDPGGWDFFGPPAPAVADEVAAGPAMSHLKLRGSWTVDGRRLAQLWIGREDGTGRVALLAVGEEAGGVTVVELGEDDAGRFTCTVEAPDRAVLHLAAADPADGPAPPRAAPPRAAPRSARGSSRGTDPAVPRTDPFAPPSAPFVPPPRPPAPGDFAPNDDDD